MSDFPQFSQQSKSVRLAEEITQLKQEIVVQQQALAETNQIFNNLKSIQQYKPFVSTAEIQGMQLHDIHEQTRKQAIQLIDKLVEQTQHHQQIVTKMQMSIDKSIQVIEQIEQKEAQFGRQQTVQQVIELSNEIQKVDKQIATMITNIQHQSLQQHKHIYAVKQAAQILQIPPITLNDQDKRINQTLKPSFTQDHDIFKKTSVVQYMHKMGVRTEQELRQERIRPMNIKSLQPRKRQRFAQNDKDEDPQKKIKRQTQSYMDTLFG